MKLYIGLNDLATATSEPLARFVVADFLQNALVDSARCRRPHAPNCDAMRHLQAWPTILSDEPLSKQLGSRHHLNAFPRGL
jgi:hypothetical protein